MTNTDSDQKSGFGFLLLLLLLLALLGGGAWYLNSTGQLEPLLARIQGGKMDDAYDSADSGSDVVVEENVVSTVAPITALAPLENMLRERVLGFPNAPIKVTEHSSLTCSHCGDFHRNTFEQFKREYLVTGKAYLVFSDFPLNAPALVASMATRCVGEENYFDMVQELFEKQDKWAYETNYLDYLEKVAAEYGLPSDLFKECTQNQELRQGILNQMQAAQTTSNIRSTPTFVVNDIGQIHGALPYEQFSQALEAAIAPAPVPADAEAGAETAPVPADAAPVAEDAVAPSASE